ncbi:MAG: alkane 1-monooxygenase AlkB1 [Immundisolibacter sp.]
MDYLRYLLPSSVMILTGLGLLAGGPWAWAGLGLFVVLAIPDSLLDFDFSERRMGAGGALAMLWIQFLPLGFLFWAYWQFLAAGPGLGQLVGAILSVAVITAAAGLPMAHELFHRSEWISRFAGSAAATLLLATYIDLEHVKSHHVETDTEADVDTPPRGMSVYPFMLKLALFMHRNCYAQEKRRLAAHGRSVWLWPGSRVLWQWLGYAIVLAIFYVADGWRSALAVFVTSLLGFFIVTIFSYVQHYGLIRVPGTPIEKRHAWNHTRPISRLLTFEIVTHSMHHMDPSVPYWKLPAYRDAPLVGSAIMYFLLSLVPPLWHRVMRRHLAHWDAHFASPDERVLAEAANRRAGWVSGEVPASA